MIYSMTGFGRGTSSSDNHKITVDIKSLNSKQLDLFMRVPGYFRELEVELRNRLTPMLERGKVDMVVQIEQIAVHAPATINIEAMKGYKMQLEQMRSELNFPEPADWYQTLLRLPDTLKTEASQLTEADKKALFEAAVSAAEELRKFRLHEGEKLYDFFIGKIDELKSLLQSVAPFEENRIVKIRARLEEQLEKLNSIEYDKGRLEQELIFYIEKLDVTEEKTRLAAHLNYFLETMGERNQIPECGQGKKLGFIAQEIGREINTLGSKSNDADMQRIVVKMKDALEQIKEQVLNVL